MVYFDLKPILYAYNEIQVPTGVQVADAADIVPAHIIANWPTQRLSNFGKLFRLEMMVKTSLSWSNSDVLFLNSLADRAPYLFIKSPTPTKHQSHLIDDCLIMCPHGDPIRQNIRNKSLSKTAVILNQLTGGANILETLKLLGSMFSTGNKFLLSAPRNSTGANIVTSELRKSGLHVYALGANDKAYFTGFDQRENYEDYDDLTNGALCCRLNNLLDTPTPEDIKTLRQSPVRKLIWDKLVADQLPMSN